MDKDGNRVTEQEEVPKHVKEIDEKTERWKAAKERFKKRKEAEEAKAQEEAEEAKRKAEEKATLSAMVFFPSYMPLFPDQLHHRQG